MSKKSSRAPASKNVAFTAEQLELAARRFRLRSGVRAGKGATGRGKSGGGSGWGDVVRAG